MKAAHQRVSFSDLEKWPEDGRRYELYDGEVYVLPSLSALHQIVLARVHRALDDYTHLHGGIALLAPLDIVLTEFDVVQPDVLLFTRERQHLVQLRKVTRHAPDLCVEILSPSTERNDRGRKVKLLAAHGVREYWLVDPESVRIEIYRLADPGFALVHTAESSDHVQSPLLPELSLAPMDVVPDNVE